MGFYGNMTNSVKTNMTFDKKYSSRKSMDNSVNSDGIYAGRYVLVEYGLSWAGALSNDKDTYDNPIGYYYKTTPKKLYKDSSYQVEADEIEGKIYWVIETSSNGTSNKKSVSDLYWYHNGSYELFIKSVENLPEYNYAMNFNIDKDVYGPGRGYDSTVWTKTYDKDGTPSYVMIAELNSVVPTFTLTVDAPSDEPNAPYFDELSTNVHYNMHIRNPWGYGVGDIEFNEAGFDPNNRSIVENPEDKITITDDFSNPKNSYNGKEEKDVKKLSINLPSIGNMVAKGWDVIHGPERDDSPSDSLQGRLDFFTKELNENEIPVQSKDGYLIGANTVDDDWINCTVDAKNKTITINHDFHSVDNTASFLNKNGNEQVSVNDNDNIKLYTPKVDEKGHVIGENIETVTLPYGFKTFTVGADSSKTDRITSNTASSIVADNTQDSLIIDPGNKWIHLAGYENEDKIIIAHEVHDQIENKEDPVDWTNGVKENEEAAIPITTYTFDEAGHHTEYHIKDYKLPFGYGQITVDNGATTVATTVYDSIAVKGDNWIAINTSGDKEITLTHKTPVGTATTVNNETPSFGKSFTIKDYHFDSNGHKFKETEHTVTIPDLTLTNDTTGNVVTSITLSETDKTFAETKANVGTLLLTDYNNTGIGDSDLTANDSLNTAFAKLQNQIHSEEEARTAAINALDVPEITTTTDEVIGSIVQTDGKISATPKNAGLLTLAGYTKADNQTTDLTINITDTLNAALGKLEYKLDTEINRVNNLNYSDTESTTQVVTTVKQDNGKISVTHTNVGNLQRVTGRDDNDNEITTTINESFANLQTQIDGTVNSITTLNGNEETSGSIQNQIKTAIESLDSEKVASNGKYISGIHIVDGKINSIDQTELPTYVSNVQADWNATEGLSEILNKPTDLIRESQIENVIRTSTEFDYETKEVINEETGESTTEITKITIDGLIEVILDLQNRIKKLEEDYSKIINSNNQPEEENPETTE